MLGKITEKGNTTLFRGEISTKYRPQGKDTNMLCLQNRENPFTEDCLLQTYARNDPGKEHIKGCIVNTPYKIMSSSGVLRAEFLLLSEFMVLFYLHLIWWKEDKGPDIPSK